MGRTGNVGSLIRSADALGARGTIVAGGAWVFSPKVLRASAGSVLHHPLAVTSEHDIIGTLRKLRQYGWNTAACVPRDGCTTSLATLTQQGPVAIVLGNEASGLPSSVVDACKTSFSLTMAGSCDSMGVAAVGAIVLHACTSTGPT